MKNVPPPPLSKRAQRLLAKHLVFAITRAAEDPLIRDYVMGAHFVIGWIESLAGHGVDTHKFFDLVRHNAPVGTLADERQLFLVPPEPARRVLEPEDLDQVLDELERDGLIERVESAE